MSGTATTILGRRRTHGKRRTRRIDARTRCGTAPAGASSEKRKLKLPNDNAVRDSYKVRVLATVVVFLHRPSSTLVYNHCTLDRRIAYEHAPLPCRNGELRESTIQANREFRENPHDWLVETIKSWEMNGNFAVENSATVGLTILTAHDTPSIGNRN